MKVGTRIKIINGGIGCLGANGRCGVVTNKPANAGLCEYEVGYNVEVDDGYVWRINEYAVVEKLAVPVNNDNPMPKLETGMFGITSDDETFVVVGDIVVFQNAGFDYVNSYDSNGECYGFDDDCLYRIEKLFNKKVKSFIGVNDGDILWERNPDPKKQRIEEIKEQMDKLEQELDYLETQL